MARRRTPRGPKAELDYQRGRLDEEYWSQLAALRRGKRVLFVEGDDDVVVVETLGATYDSNFEARVLVYPAGDRSKVLKKTMAADEHLHGLVDRDVWTDAEVTAKQEAQPGLWVTSGWCLENSFVDPDLLEQALALPAGRLDEVRDAVAAWHEYGVVRWVLQRARERFAGCWPEADYGRPDRGEALDEAALRQQLARLSAVPLHCEGLLAEISDRRDALAGAARLHQSVHGKQFFRQVVVPALNRALGQQDERYWRDEIARKWPRTAWPAELLSLFQSLLP